MSAHIYGAWSGRVTMNSWGGIPRVDEVTGAKAAILSCSLAFVEPARLRNSKMEFIRTVDLARLRTARQATTA